MSWDKGSSGKWTLEIPTDQAFVYVAWGLDERRPLYVGKTRSLMGRLGQHEQASPWFRYVRRLEVYGFRSELAALEAEAQAIHDLQPAFNRTGITSHIPAVLRYRRRKRSPVPLGNGPPITTDEISPDQLAIVARVQNRRRSSCP